MFGELMSVLVSEPQHFVNMFREIKACGAMDYFLQAYEPKHIMLIRRGIRTHNFIYTDNINVQIEMLVAYLLLTSERKDHKSLDLRLSTYPDITSPLVQRFKSL